MENSTQIILLLIFSLIYVFFQELKRLMIKEMDECLYNSVKEYFLSGEYYFIGLWIMAIADFDTYELGLGFVLMFVLRFAYNRLVYKSIYNKLSRKIKRYNTHKK